MTHAKLTRAVEYTQRFDSHPQSAALYAMIDAAKGANSILRNWFEKAKASETPDMVLGTHIKSDLFAHLGFENAMTVADTDSEKFIIATLKACKDIPIVAEESGHSVDDASIPEGGQRWLIDPLDGTYCFKHGNPDFSSTIALQRKVAGKWVTELGLVSNPMHDEIYIADAAQAFLIQDNRSKVLTNRTPEPAAFTGSIDSALKGKDIDICVFDKDSPTLHSARERIIQRIDAQKSATLAYSTALMVAKMADGWIDGTIIGGKGALEFAWDTDAAIHIAEKAGIHCKRFEMAGQPWILLANTKSLLNALESIARQEYRAVASAASRAA